MATDLANQSTTPGSNTSISGVSIAEGCAPSNVNDGMRAIIAQAKGALLAVTSAGTNTITATYAPVPDAYVSGWLYPFKAGGTNTGATTFNANSLGAKDVKTIASAGKQALQGGEIISGGFYVLQYDGTDMLLLNPTPQEGSWTPAIAGGSTAGTQTYSTQVGRYIRQGNLVTAWFSTVMTAKDGTTAGAFLVTGLPFTSTNVSGLSYSGQVGAAANIDLSAGYSQIGILVSANTTSITVNQIGDNVAAAGLTAAAIAATTELRGSVTYRIG
jgi:hypothetical protein